jgi:hypothetical protein
MKLHTATHIVDGQGLGDTAVATIKATAKAFSILSSSLYSDKIAAPIRELCCNAYDAHVAAGCADRPIEVKLPNVLDPVFAVKDYGTGLPHEKVMSLYLTYFDSTKSDSNDFIGALGLGSKSPFAYTNRFTVESRYNGVVSIYTTYINEQGSPAVTKLSEEPTDEPNGLTVSFAVKRGDEDKFCAAARKALMYFKPTPIFSGVNLEPYALKHRAAGSNWMIREAAYYAYMSGAYVVQGFVAYPIDRSILAEHGLSELGQQICSMNIDVTVNIGAVEIAPSREALSYDPQTIQALIAHIEHVGTELRDSFQQKFDQAADGWDARLKYVGFKDSSDNALSSIFSGMHKQTPFTYNGTPVSPGYKLDLRAVKQTSIFNYYLTKHMRKLERSGQWTPGGGNDVFSFQVQPNLQIIVDDIVKGSASIIEYHMRKMMSTSGIDNARVIVIRPTLKSLYSEAEIDSIIKQFDGVKKVLLSSFNYPIVKQQTSYKPRAKGHCLKFTGFPENGGYRKNEIRRVYSRLTWATEPVDFEEGGFYMPMRRFTPMHDGRDVDCLDMIFDKAIELGLLTNDDLEKTYGFSEKDVASVKDDPDWVNVFDHIITGINALIASGTMTNSALVSQIQAHGWFVSYMCSDKGMRDMLVNDLPVGPMRDLIEECALIYTSKSNLSSHTLNELCALLMVDGMREHINKRIKELNVLMQNAVRQYPILSMIRWDGITRNGVHNLIEYVRLVDCPVAVQPAVELKAA